MNETNFAFDAPIRIDPLDFSCMDGFECKWMGNYRLSLNETATARPQDQVILFVHGAFHGAWCYSAYLKYLDQHGYAAAALDLTGHGGLDRPEMFETFGVARFADDVIGAVKVLQRPVFLAGHSVGALICAYAAQSTEIAGLGLIAPSPPGNLPGAQPIPLVPTDTAYEAPGPQAFQQKYLNDPIARDLTPVHDRLCAESPALLNERYGLKVHVKPDAIGCTGFCIEAGREDPKRHPTGQDRTVADFFGLSHFVLPAAPHCMMLSESWEESAAIILGFVSGARAGREPVLGVLSCA